MDDAFPIVVGQSALTIGLGFVYFRRARLARPPIGVFNARDVKVVLAAIVLVPYIYLALPLWAVTGLMSLAALTVGAFTLEPVVPRRLAWLLAVALVAADVAAAAVYSTRSNAFLVVNDAALALVVVGIANLWAQSGMSARNLAVLAGALTAYDVVATSGLTLMTDLIARLGQVPFLPVAAWDLHDGTGLGIGLGDLLFATVFPLVMRKAFGVGPALLAAASAVTAIAAMLAAIDLRLVPTTIPAMVVLGPAIVGQIALWRRRLGQERTTAQYLRDEPLGRTATTRSGVVDLPTGLRAPVATGRPALEVNTNAYERG